MSESENITGEVQNVQLPDAGETNERVSFDELIEGDYREDYKERVESIVKQRLKTHAEDKQRLGEITRELEALAKSSGIEATDPSEIIAVLRTNRDTPTDTAGEAFSQKEKESRVISEFAPPVVDRVKELARRVEAAKEIYPDMDIVSELRDPVFAQLLTASRGDVRRAYEMKYHDRIVTHAMQYAAESARQKLSDSMASKTGRPAENAVSGSAAVMMAQDPKNLTRAQRSEIKKRVRRGERILW